MDSGERRIEITPSVIKDQHGLCETAETHWAIYLIQLINSGLSPSLHEGTTVDGAVFKYLVKGEDLHDSNFTFGADSFLIASSSDNTIKHLLLVDEGDDVFSARPLLDFDTSLKVNGFYDTEIRSRWKDVINQFATEKKIMPGSLTIPQLIKEAVPST